VKVGERLAIARRLPEPARTIEWPDDRVALLGQLIGDGSYLSNAPMRYTTASEENSELVTRAATREFGAKVTRYRGRGTWHQLMISGNGNRWHPAGVNAWLRELGVFGQRSHEKRVPREAFRLSNRQVAILLRHLWATDGSIGPRPNGALGGHKIYYATGSRGLAHDVSTLLMRFGIVTRTAQASKPGYRVWWHVYVSGALDQRWFLNKIGAFGPRVAPARRLARAIEGTVPNTNVDTLPRQVFARVQELMIIQGLSARDMASLRGVTSDGSRQAKFAPSRWLMSEYAEVLDDNVLRSWAESDLFWDRVVALESNGEEVVYDLTVPGPRCWFGGVVLSHNSGSLEQDSDIVTFIHRDDSDPEKKRSAELMVAKHRNGPTGSIPLNFEPSLTQFRNASRDVPQ
jgi:replicative DNA helicase